MLYRKYRICCGYTVGTIDDIAATDIVALFGNILSNAYEAAKQCEKLMKNISNWLLRESKRQHLSNV